MKDALIDSSIVSDSYVRKRHNNTQSDYFEKYEMLREVSLGTASVRAYSAESFNMFFSNMNETDIDNKSKRLKKANLKCPFPLYTLSR